MSYAIVYSSKTGNTRLLADAIREVAGDDCIYFGGPSDAALSADILYVGFWTDKGTCDSTVADFLKKLDGKKVFLFGTAGFGGSSAYFEQILGRVRTCLPGSAHVSGSYMCQGKMPDSVKLRYEKMKADHAPVPDIDGMLLNFEKAKTHPDETDLSNLKKLILSCGQD